MDVQLVKQRTNSAIGCRIRESSAKFWLDQREQDEPDHVHLRSERTWIQRLQSTDFHFGAVAVILNSCCAQVAWRRESIYMKRSIAVAAVFFVLSSPSEAKDSQTKFKIEFLCCGEY